MPDLLSEPRLETERVLRPALHHVNIRTKRLDEIVEWYRVVVGLEPNFHDRGVAFLTNDDANHRLAVITLPDDAADPLDRARSVGMHHIAFEYASLDELLGSYVRLKRDGIEPVYCLDHGLTISFYYLDPDGNYVELQVDAHGDWSASTAFLRTDERFVADPIGPEIDPDAMLAARAECASADELHERAYRAEFAPDVPRRTAPRV